MKKLITILFSLAAFAANSQSYTIRDIVLHDAGNDTFCVKVGSPDTIWKKTWPTYTFYYRSSNRRYVPYTSIVNTPTTLEGYGISDAAPTSHTHAYADITGKPTLFDGAYNTLTGKPDFTVYKLKTDTGRVGGNAVTGASLKWIIDSITANIALKANASAVSNVTNESKATMFTGPQFTSNVGIAGKITNYNSINTVSNGVPSIVAEVNATAQVANIGTTALYTTPAAGFYRVSIYITVTTVATTSSTMPNTSIVYTDGNSGTNGHSTTTTATSAGNSVTSTFAQVTHVFYAKASTNINYATGSYASSGATAMQYALRIRLEAL